MSLHRVLLDESGDGSSTSPLLVAAVSFADYEDAAQRVQAQYDWLLESERLRDLESFDLFKEEGFHYSTNPWEVRFSFIDFLTTLPGIRAFVAFSTGGRLERRSLAERTLVLYGSFLPDVILSSAATDVHLAFEENTSLNRFYPRLTADAATRAGLKAPLRTMPNVTSSITSKAELAMGVTDYVLAIVSGWVREGLSKDVTKAEFRNYRALMGNIAVVLDFDQSLRSDRSNREFH